MMRQLKESVKDIMEEFPEKPKKAIGGAITGDEIQDENKQPQ